MFLSIFFKNRLYDLQMDSEEAPLANQAVQAEVFGQIGRPKSAIWVRTVRGLVMHLYSLVM